MSRLSLCAAFCGAVFATSPAFAHVGLQPPEIAAGSYTKLTFSVPHGCDGQATETFELRLPRSIEHPKPMPKAGWTIEIEAFGGETLLRWTGGSLDDAHYDEFSVRVHAGDMTGGMTIPIPARQICASAEVVWDAVAAEGQDPHDLDHPAPVLRIAEASGHGSHGEHAGHGGHAGHDAAPGSAEIGDIAVSDAIARPSLGAAPTSAVYMNLSTSGGGIDRLIGASSPAAKAVEIHESRMSDGVMQMGRVEAIDVIPGRITAFAPGGLHVMLIGLTAPLVEGETIPLTLTFETAGEVTLQVPVGQPGAAHGH